MISFFESFAQIGLPGESSHKAIPGMQTSDRVCYVDEGEEVCFSHEELSFAVLW